MTLLGTALDHLPARVRDKASTHREMITFAVVGAMAFAVDTVDFHPQVDGPAFHPGHGQNHRHTAGHDRLLRVEPAIFLPASRWPGPAPRGCAVHLGVLVQLHRAAGCTLFGCHGKAMGAVLGCARRARERPATTAVWGVFRPVVCPRPSRCPARRPRHQVERRFLRPGARLLCSSGR